MVGFGDSEAGALSLPLVAMGCSARLLVLIVRFVD